MKLILEILDNFKDATLGGVGGLVAYLYHYSNSRKKDPTIKLDKVSFIINGIVGAFVAHSFGSLVPETFEYRDAIIGSLGVAGFGVMGAIESKIVDVIFSKFMK